MKNNKSPIMFNNKNFKGYRELAEHVTLNYNEVKKLLLSNKDDLDMFIKKLNPLYFVKEEVSFEDMVGTPHDLCVRLGVSSYELSTRLSTYKNQEQFKEALNRLLLEKYLSQKSIATYGDSNGYVYCENEKFDKEYYAYLLRKGVSEKEMLRLLRQQRDYLFLFEVVLYDSFEALSVASGSEKYLMYNKAINGDFEVRHKPVPVKGLSSNPYSIPNDVLNYLSSDDNLLVRLLNPKK